MTDPGDRMADGEEAGCLTRGGGVAAGAQEEEEVIAEMEVEIGVTVGGTMVSAGGMTVTMGKTAEIDQETGARATTITGGDDFQNGELSTPIFGWKSAKWHWMNHQDLHQLFWTVAFSMLWSRDCDPALQFTEVRQQAKWDCNLTLGSSYRDPIVQPALRHFHAYVQAHVC